MRVSMFKPYVNERAIELVTATLRSGWIGEGPMVHKFERELKRVFGLTHVSALNSGTASLRLALQMARIGPGDEVITTAQTCTATNMVILEVGATPVFADVEYDTGNLDPDDIPHRITDRTRAIMCVHWAGLPCDMDRIAAIADGCDLTVIEDGAHALGALYKGRPVGTLSRFTMFSFQAIKQITTADGGLLAMRDQEDEDLARRLRWFGIDRNNRRVGDDGYAYYDQRDVGFKMHMNDVAASIGLGNLEDVDALAVHRRGIVARYRTALAGVPGVTLFRSDTECDSVSGHWLFTMHVERRRDFHRAMKDRGVDTSVVHVRNDAHSVFGPRRTDLPVLDRYEQTHISIPLHSLLTDEEVEHVIDSVRAGW